MKRPKALWRRIAAYGFPVLLSILCFEMGSRYYYERYYLKEIGTADAPVILTIGDSFCAPETSYPYLLGEKLAGRYRVVNAAESGAGPDHYLMNLSLTAKKKPRVCIVSFYLGNDILNLRKFRTSPRTARLKLFLGSHLYSYHLVRRFWVAMKYRSSAPEMKKTAEQGVLNPHMFEAAKKDPLRVARNLAVEGEDIVGSWNALETLVEKMGRLARKQGIPLFAVLIPVSAQVSDQYQEVYKRAGFKLPGKTTRMTRPQELIIEILKENRIAYLDLLPEFRTRQDRGIYYRNDPHMTPEGHVVAVDILSETLLGSGLLP